MEVELQEWAVLPAMDSVAAGNVEFKVTNMGPKYPHEFVVLKTNLRRRFLAALTAARLPSQRFHDLRHACATLRLEQGEELAVMSRILGHASISTTADTYGHLTDAMLGRAADRTDVILGHRSATA